MDDDLRHWRMSCALNARLGGDPDEPLCSRVFRQPAAVWRAAYSIAMDIRFRERGHCARIFGEWLEGRGSEDVRLNALADARAAGLSVPVTLDEL